MLKNRSHAHDGLLPSRGSLLRALIHGANPDRPRQSRRYSRKARGAATAAAYQPPEGRRTRRRICNCGQCPRCLEDARWDRIFNEKFADPYYYGPIQVRQSSSLAELPW